MTTLEICFVDGSNVEVNFAGDINLHDLNGKALIFDDIYINLEQVKLIVKKVAENE